MFRILIFKFTIAILLDLKETRIRYKRYFSLRTQEDDFYGDKDWIIKTAEEDFWTLIWFMCTFLFIRLFYHLIINNL